VLEFVRQWKSGKLEPVYKSEPNPDPSFEHGIRVLSALGFEELVVNTTKDVLVIFYAPWCLHSKKLLEELEDLIKSIQHEFPYLEIAKLNSIANEVPEHPIQAFPTIKLFMS
jgi:protein disulfide-isomerase A1